MSVSTPFTARFGIYPIIQAPMAGVSTPALAAAVSNAGGLGSLGLGASSVEQARRLIGETRALTTRPFNVNLFCHAPAARDTVRERAWLQHLEPLFAEFGAQAPGTINEIYKSFVVQPDMLDMLIDERPAIVSFHFGLPPKEWINELRRAGIYTLATATHLHEAQLIAEAQVDAIVAQGIEAGGHRGIFDTDALDLQLSTTVLVRELVTATPLPVIASGGIMNGQGIRAALDLGAAAAQLGTAFVLCPESSANAGYRKALQSERAAMTRLTRTLSGRPARGIVNRFITFCEAPSSPLPASYPVAYDAAKQLMAIAARQGSDEFSAFWAGQGAPHARALPAEELIAVLVKELIPNEGCFDCLG